MDFAVIEPGLAAIASVLTGVNPLCCQWENAPRAQSDDGRLVLLSWVSISPRGTDETSWDFDAGASNPLLEMTPTVGGQRVASWQLSIQSPDQSPGQTSRHLAERARTRLQWPSTLAGLRALGLALASAGDTTPADYPVDGRWVSRTILEVRLNASASEVDTAGRTGHIATVVLDGTVTGVTGDPIPDSLQPQGTFP